MVKIEKRTLSLIEFKFGGNQNVESGVFKLFSSVRFINEIWSIPAYYSFNDVLVYLLNWLLGTR